MTASSPPPSGVVLCPSCGRPLQEFLLPSLDGRHEFVRVWGCETCGESMAPPQAPKAPE